MCQAEWEQAGGGDKREGQVSELIQREACSDPPRGGGFPGEASDEMSFPSGRSEGLVLAKGVTSFTH